MQTFDYQILRYMPDRVNGEFLNLGIVMFQVETAQIEFKFISKTGRISEVFPGTNSRFLIKTIERIKINLTSFKELQTQKLTLEPIISLDSLTRKVLPKDDSALFFTNTEKTLDVSIEVASGYLFKRLISMHQNIEEKEIKQDKEVWSKVYKKYFEEAGITHHLRQHQIKTKFDEFNFDHSWKNGHWNFFEPISFIQNRKEQVKNKVYKMAGKIESLSKSDEYLHLYLLSLLPAENDLVEFVNEILTSKSNKKLKVEIITQDNITKMTTDLMNEINVSL